MHIQSIYTHRSEKLTKMCRQSTCAHAAGVHCAQVHMFPFFQKKVGAAAHTRTRTHTQNVRAPILPTNTCSQKTPTQTHPHAVTHMGARAHTHTQCQSPNALRWPLANDKRCAALEAVKRMVLFCSNNNSSNNSSSKTSPCMRGCVQGACAQESMCGTHTWSL